MEQYPLIIIGSGPAGLTSAIYAARARLQPLVLAGISFGGQLMNTTEVENFPGFPEGIMGPLLMQNMIAQAQKFGATVLYEHVNEIEVSARPFSVTTNNSTYTSDSIIIATGAEPKKLGLDSETTFWGRGVSSCATCDGAFYKDKVVAVIGGGDSAMEEATFLTKFASKVYIIHRRNEFRASQIMQERVTQNPKIEVVWNSTVKEITGEQTVNGLVLEHVETRQTSTLAVDGVFLAIGYTPNTTFLQGKIDLRPNGYIDAKGEIFTNVEGIFVAGDVEDEIYRQAITAAGAGCKAAIAAEKWLGGRETLIRNT